MDYVKPTQVAPNPPLTIKTLLKIMGILIEHIRKSPNPEPDLLLFMEQLIAHQ